MNVFESIILYNLCVTSLQRMMSPAELLTLLDIPNDAPCRDSNTWIFCWKFIFSTDLYVCLSVLLMVYLSVQLPMYGLLIV